MLEVENPDLFYGDAQAPGGVSVSVKEGADVAIVGANGAGKSSLIRTIAGMRPPKDGHIRYRGQNSTGWPSHKVCDLGIDRVRQAYLGL